jgi:hypothetical protein
MKLTNLSDDELLSHAKAICDQRSQLLARLILVLIEVEERRLHERKACATMFEFCRKKLGMSEPAAFRRSAAAQLVRRFPSLLGAIERGELHLSNLLLLRGHLTAENVGVMVAEVAGKNARQVQEFLARRAPRPDVPTDVRPVPVETSLAFDAVAAAAAAPSPRPRIEALSAERYAMQLTIGRDLLEKLERARDLMMHANPKGDLAVVVDRAVDALLSKLEKERLAKTDRPQKKKRPCVADHVPAATKREVFGRDGERCTYVDEATGERCTARALLEIDHIEPRARGGASDDAANLRVRCRSHNRLHAEVCFGRAHVEARIDLRRRKGDAEAAELVRSGLVHMGFSNAEAKKALGILAERHANDDLPLPKETMLVEALGLLT